MIELEVVNNFENQRRDNWWFAPALMASYLIIFGIYTFWVILFLPRDQAFLHWNTSASGTNYLSPFYSPDIEVFGIKPPTINIFGFLWAVSPAIFVIWGPVGFRATCYYGRKVYYRSFFMSPPACAVDGLKTRKGKYHGEEWSVFKVVHFHRYFFYLAVILVIFHWIETFQAFQFRNSGGGLSYGIGLGTLLSLTDAILLTLYTMTCHSFRNLLGGTNTPGSFRYWLWNKISKINKYHGNFFWYSIVTILVVDVYFRFVAWGTIVDPRWLF